MKKLLILTAESFVQLFENQKAKLSPKNNGSAISILNQHKNSRLVCCNNSLSKFLKDQDPNLCLNPEFSLIEANDAIMVVSTIRGHYQNSAILYAVTA